MKPKTTPGNAWTGGFRCALSYLVNHPGSGKKVKRAIVRRDRHEAATALRLTADR